MSAPSWSRESRPAASPAARSWRSTAAAMSPCRSTVSAVDAADALKFKIAARQADRGARRGPVRPGPGQAPPAVLEGPPTAEALQGPVAPEDEDPLVLDGALTQKAVLPKWAYDRRPDRRRRWSCCGFSCSSRSCTQPPSTPTSRRWRRRPPRPKPSRTSWRPRSRPSPPTPRPTPPMPPPWPPSAKKLHVTTTTRPAPRTTTTAVKAGPGQARRRRRRPPPRPRPPIATTTADDHPDHRHHPAATGHRPQRRAHRGGGGAGHHVAPIRSPFPPKAPWRSMTWSSRTSPAGPGGPPGAARRGGADRPSRFWWRTWGI